MTALHRIWILAVNTVREAIRNKLLYTLLGFAVTVIGAGVLVASLSYVEGHRIIQDVGISAIRLFSVGIAIFVGIGLIHGEVERRTIYTILSKPVSRAEFLLGKFVGLTCTVWLMLVLMSLAFFVVSAGAGAPFDFGYVKMLAMVGLELMLIVAVATLFSSFTTPMLAALFSLGVYVLGLLSRDLRALGEQADSAAVAQGATILYRVLPDLEMFNRSVEAVHQMPIPVEELGLATLYALLYSASLLIFAIMLFGRRDFK